MNNNCDFDGVDDDDDDDYDDHDDHDEKDTIILAISELRRELGRVSNLN